jgi:hypothetical protein
MSERKPKQAKKGTRKRSTPAGMRLNDEQMNLIVGAIEAGATDHVAAEAAGISARSFREMRQRAEARHPTRRSTPALIAFIERVNVAAARARMRQEIEVSKSDPKHWLKYQARSKPGLDGWTEPIPEETSDQSPRMLPTAAQLQETFLTLLEARVLRVPPCADTACPCAHHIQVAQGGDHGES